MIEQERKVDPLSLFLFFFPKRRKLFLTEPNSNSLLTEIQVVAEVFEEKCTLAEGQTLKVSCPTNTNIYSRSQKAWQRLKDNGEVQTLAITEGSSQVQVGKYFLEDIPSEGILQVRVFNLQVEDSGLYRCVILGPRDPIILFSPVRLVVTKGE